MFRRQVLKKGGILAGSSLAFSSSAIARGDGELPNGNVSVTTVGPWRSKANAKEVPAGDWVRHGIAWVDLSGDGEPGAHESTREDIERWLDAKEFSAWIDGEQIENADQRWVEPFLTNEGLWRTHWTYSTPPKAPGLYSVRMHYEYPNGYSDGPFQIPEGATTTLKGWYEVVPERGKGMGKP